MHTRGRRARATGPQCNQTQVASHGTESAQQYLAKDERGPDLRNPPARVNLIDASQSSETALAALAPEISLHGRWFL